MLDARLLRHAGIGQPTGQDLDLVGAMPNQAVADAAAEAAAVTQDVDGLQNGSFASAIGAQQKINARNGR